MKRHPLKNARAFRTSLLKWFSTERKNYPWRETSDPWAILVSEIMLQQTTVASVIANRRFEKFLHEFPDLAAIANAPEEQLLRAWEGLGYYNRVRNLQKTARTVLELHEGTFPHDADTLQTLPGVGKYTAGAVSSFAFDEPAPIVDGNIARVLARLFDYREAIDSTGGQKQLWQWASELLDRKNPRLFNSAIMELGQTYCSPRQPTCLTCPVRNFCQASDPTSLPIKKPRKKFIPVEEHALLVLHDGHILLAKEQGSRRQGFWHLPIRDAESVSHLEISSNHHYTITHHRVTLSLYRTSLKHLPDGISENEELKGLETIDQLPIPSPVRRIIEGQL